MVGIVLLIALTVTFVCAPWRRARQLYRTRRPLTGASVSEVAFNRRLAHPPGALRVHPRPRRNDHDLVGVRIAWDETDLRIAVKKAGAIWRPRQKLWEISWDVVRALGIGHRVVTG